MLCLNIFILFLLLKNIVFLLYRLVLKDNYGILLVDLLDSTVGSLV